MKDTIKKIRDSIAAIAAGKTEAEFEKERLQQGVSDAVSRWLADHPDYYADVAQEAAPTQQPVTDSRQKANRIMKTLGAHCFRNAGDAYAAAYAKYNPSRLAKQAAGASQNATTGTDGDIDADALAKAREAARAAKDASPERYAHIIN